MTQTPGQNNETDGTPLNQPVSSAERTTLDFVTAINSFHWRTDYFKFCQVLGLIPDNYAEEKYSQFQELISNLNQFDVDMLTTASQGERDCNHNPIPVMAIEASQESVSQYEYEEKHYGRSQEAKRTRSKFWKTKDNVISPNQPRH